MCWQRKQEDVRLKTLRDGDESLIYSVGSREAIPNLLIYTVFYNTPKLAETYLNRRAT